MLDQHYLKTELGRAEIKARALTLSRSARNLLLVLDATRSARAWLALVQGATEADVIHLLANHLIAAPVAAAPAPTVSPLSYEQLYGYLTGHAKKYLGLMKGYRMVLDVERCTDLPALQELAARFVLDVEQAQGAAVADQVRQSLGLKS